MQGTYTEGNYKTLEELRAEGRKMKRVAFGFVKAWDAHEALKKAGARTEGTILYTYARSKLVYGLTAEGKAFVYDEAGYGVSSLYVEQ